MQKRGLPIEKAMYLIDQIRAKRDEIYAIAPKGDATFLSRVTKGLTTAAFALAAIL